MNDFYQHAKETCVFYNVKTFNMKDGTKRRTCGLLTRHYCFNWECPFYKDKREWAIDPETEFLYKIKDHIRDEDEE